jgi:hypothetical protein
MALALLLPPAMRSGKEWLAWVVLGVYGAIILFLLWVLRGWGRFAATLVIGLEIVGLRWVPPESRMWVLISIPVVFLLGWVIDWRLRKRWEEPG